MTTDEIVRALRCISTPDITHLCNGCKYRKSNGCDADEVNKDAIRLIEQLTAENTALREGTKMKRSQKQDYEKQIKSLQALADRQSSEIKKLQADLDWKSLLAESALDAQERAEKAEAERDALIEQIKERHDCLDCKHNDYCEFDDANVIDCMNCVQEGCPCIGCCDSGRWEWRGLPEAPEKGEKEDA